jgi:hypothetical protein
MKVFRLGMNYGRTCLRYPQTQWSGPLIVKQVKTTGPRNVGENKLTGTVVRMKHRQSLHVRTLEFIMELLSRAVKYRW